ncbi:MAG: tetratricopeptide repeat protein [Deltaproteobacteria bacterium]|nr:tetratricopeptide repeat protein [Deltaproteobacteria bacterium]
MYGRRRPHLAVGWLWYLGTLVPVIGIVQVGSQAMADRYTYVPLIGIFIAVSWGGIDLLGWWHRCKPLLVTFWAAVILSLLVVTRVQTAYWRDNVSLYTRAIAVTEKNWLAWNNLGNYHLTRGDVRQALSLFQEALRIKPDYPDAWYNAGVVFSRVQDYLRAIAFYEKALQLDPTNADGWVNQGLPTRPLISTRKPRLATSPLCE